MKDINSLLKSITLFFPFFIIFYITFIILGNNLPQDFKPNINYKKGSPGYLFTRLKDLKNYQNVDVLFLGSSHAYRSFDTRIFKNHGIISFNLGSSSQSPIQTEVMLERYLDKLNPKLIIFEVSPMVFMSDGVESSLDLISNDKNDILTLTKLIRWNNIKTINTAIVGFYRDFLHLDDNFVEPIKKGDDIYIHGGFVERKISYFKPPVRSKKKYISLNLKTEQINAFKRCVAKIHSKNIKVIFVKAPITKFHYSSYLNTQNFDSLISTQGEYYNFNNILNLEDSLYFFDSHHLNQKGVKVFDEKLIQILNDELKNIRQ